MILWLLGLTTAAICVSWPKTNFCYVVIYRHVSISAQYGQSSLKQRLISKAHSVQVQIHDDNILHSCSLDLELKSKCNDQGHSKAELLSLTKINPIKKNITWNKILLIV